MAPLAFCLKHISCLRSTYKCLAPGVYAIALGSEMASLDQTVQSTKMPKNMQTKPKSHYIEYNANVLKCTCIGIHVAAAGISSLLLLHASHGVASSLQACLSLLFNIGFLLDLLNLFGFYI